MRKKKTESSHITSEPSKSTGNVVTNGAIFEDPLMTTAELAAYIRHKPATVMKWRKNGANDQPPFIRIRKKTILYRKSEVEKWLNRNPYLKGEVNK